VKLVLGVACAVLAAAGAARAAPTLVALTGSGALLVFDAEHPEAAAGVAVHGESGTLVGIDLRPADRKLYGLTTTNEIYRIDPRTGEAKLLCSLTAPFDGGARSGIDFNPQADRLRLVSSEGQNLRVNVEIGATAVDRPLAYAPGDPNAGRRPGIAASAYDHPVAGATTTKLYEIDAARDVLVVQDPPNDGVLRTVGPLGVDFAPEAGFDIVSLPTGEERAYAATGSTLYAIDLASGSATKLGVIGPGGDPIVSLSAAGTD
jgi:hypothetical protein